MNIFQIFSKEYINLLLTSYFLLLGIGALTASFIPIFARILGESRNRKGKRARKGWLVLPTFITFWTKEKISFTTSDILAFISAIFLCIWYCWKKHWVANNILGLAFSLQAISLISMGSYQIACILLSGLFVYDIFWVFATDVMVTVAKKFDAPVKLMFPRNFLAPSEDPWQYSMLGLGDIVIPGFFIALLLRFDHKLFARDRHEQQQQQEPTKKINNGKSSQKKKSATRGAAHPVRAPYFHYAFLAYALGLTTTIAVMHVFQAAQPALLYLVPFCILASVITAVARGELGLLWEYTEQASPDPPQTKTITINAQQHHSLQKQQPSSKKKS